MPFLTEALLERGTAEKHVLQDLVFLPRLRIVMFFISKNASSYLKNYLSCLETGRKGLYPPDNPHKMEANKFLGVRDLGHEKFSRLLADDSIPRFVVGRHPVERFLSAFNSRVATWQREHYNEAESARKEWLELRQRIIGANRGYQAAGLLEALGTNITIDDLVYHVSITPSGFLDRHLIPQSYYVGSDMIEYSFIGQTEDLSTAVERICSETGSEPIPNAPILNATQVHFSDSFNLGARSIKTLEARYSNDFEFFGYSKS